MDGAGVKIFSFILHFVLDITSTVVVRCIQVREDMMTNERNDTINKYYAAIGNLGDTARELSNEIMSKESGDLARLGDDLNIVFRMAEIMRERIRLIAQAEAK